MIRMRGAGRRAAAVAACLASLWPALAAGAADETPIRWDMESLARVVKPMRHDMKARMPLVLWNFPLPRNDDLVKLRSDGTLRKHIDTLAARGIVPTVEMGWEWTPAGAMAMARTLQEAGRPVYVLLPRVDLLEGTAYRDCNAWGEGPDATRRGETRKWPCLPLADPKLTAEWLRGQLQPFKDAGIPLAAVWFDDECLPHPWNGCYEAQRASAECRKHYPAGVMDNFAAFRKWADAFRFDLFTKGAAEPVKAMFPGVLVGEYGDEVSGTDKRYGLDVQMPSAYANTCDLPRAFKDRQVTQPAADLFYFRQLLEIVSRASAKVIAGKLSMPYISRFVVDNPDEKYRFPMSQDVYRELVRHVWLRGADGLYLFNLGYPTTPQTVTAEFSFQSVEDARSVTDELLAHREFLDKGAAMTFAVPKAVDAEAVWSGRRLPGGRCLVRAVSLGKDDSRVRVGVAEGVAVELDAPRSGATYVISAAGDVRKVASGRM